MNHPEPEGDEGELTRLRLRLNHAEMQRDAFAAALTKEVRQVIARVIQDEISRVLGGPPKGCFDRPKRLKD